MGAAVSPYPLVNPLLIKYNRNCEEIRIMGWKIEISCKEVKKNGFHDFWDVKGRWVRVASISHNIREHIMSEF